MKHPNETGRMRYYKPNNWKLKAFLIADLLLVVLIVLMWKS